MVKNLLITLVITLFSVFQLFAQSDEQAFEELKNAFIKAIELGSDESLMQYRITSQDLEEIIESVVEEKREEVKKNIEETGGSEAVAKKYNDYFDESFNKLQEEEVQSLDLNKINLEYDIEIQEEKLPNIKLAQVRIYQPDTKPMIDINLLKLKRGWIVMNLDVYYKEFSEGSSEKEIIKE